jgi:hypothetical protein
MAITEKVFLGFQFDSKYYRRSDLECLLVESVTEASREIKKYGLDYVSLVPQLCDLTPAEGVTEGILDFINKSIFCLFEISDNNPNVMFELGNAYAKNKGLIFLKNSESSIYNKVPSDLIGKFVTYYGEENPSLQGLKPKIAGRLRDYVIEEYNKKAETWMKKIWEIRGDHLTVVSGNLFGRYEVESKDADALFDSTVGIINLYPCTKIKRIYSIDFKDEGFTDTDLLVVGGPDSNKVTQKVFESLDSSFPFDYEEVESPIDFVLKDKTNHRNFKKEWEGAEKDENLKRDYGFFMKIPNPFSVNRNILIITGIGAYGTYGCAKALPFSHEQGKNLFEYYVQNFAKFAAHKYFTFVTETVVDKTKIQGRVVEGSLHYLNQETNKWVKL